jgi:hypothetical protein
MKLLNILLKTYKDEYELNLKEGLIKTTPLGESVYILKKQFPNWFFTYEKEGNDFTIEILEEKDGIKLEYFEKLLPVLNNLGYFISYMEILGYWDSYTKKDVKIKDKYKEDIVRKAFNNPKIYSILLICEAKFDQKVNNIPEILYHVTPLRSWEKIQKIGLIPKSRSKRSYHPERVYLGKDENSTIKLTPKFYQDTGLNEWVLLKINTNHIPGNYLRLYQDPNFKYGYYTLNNIPPQAIEKIKDIKL